MAVVNGQKGDAASTVTLNTRNNE